MADTSTTTPGDQKARSSSAARSMMFDMADTTWRMFVPTIGLLLVGRHFDITYDTKPWLMLVGAVLGAGIAALLVKNQFKCGGATT